MSEIMERVLTMSVQAGVFILCILLITKLTEKRISPRLRYGLWLLPAVRLLVPVRFESALSLMSAAQRSTKALPVLPVVSAPIATPAMDSAAAQASIAPILPPALPEATPEAVTQAAPDVMTVLFWVWLCGMAVVLAYMLFVNLRFYRRVRRKRTPVDTEARPPVYRMAGLSSPCLCGYFKPCILMNAQALKSESVYKLVLRHELCHYRGGDQWWALLRNLCCIVHWFNPIVWWAAFRCRADCELACDARVMQGFSQAQCEGYGMALLSIIHTNGKPKGVADLSTSMTDGKRELKRRIRNIGDRPKVLWLAAALVLVLSAIAGFVACADVVEPIQNASPLEIEAMQAPIQELSTIDEANALIASPSPTLSPEEQSLARRTAHGDFDGDGREDVAFVEGYYEKGDDESPHATLTVQLSSDMPGEPLTYEFEGYWNANSLFTGDFDGDGREDLALFLIDWGSNYDGGVARVLRIENGALTEFPYTKPVNEALPVQQGNAVFEGVIGISVIQAEGRDALRLQLPIDVRERNTAWYVDLAFNAQAWDTLSMALGEAYGERLLPDTGTLPEVDVTHRPGFTLPELTFTGSNSVEEYLPNIRYYDWDTGTLSPTAEEMAVSAIRQLYDMTGVQIQRCYYSGTWNSLSFSTNKSGKQEFLGMGYGVSTTGETLYILRLGYKGKQLPDSPIDPSAVIKPEGYAGMTRPALALWYYENSSYGDRRAVVNAIEHDIVAGYMKLVLASGEFYEVGFDEESGLPNSFYGPYEEGYAH